MEYFLLRKIGTDTFYKHTAYHHVLTNMAGATIFKTIGGTRRSQHNGMEIVRVEYDPMITGVID